MHENEIWRPVTATMASRLFFLTKQKKKRLKEEEEKTLFLSLKWLKWCWRKFRYRVRQSNNSSPSFRLFFLIFCLLLFKKFRADGCAQEDRDKVSGWCTHQLFPFSFCFVKHKMHFGDVQRQKMSSFLVFLCKNRENSPYSKQDAQTERAVGGRGSCFLCVGGWVVNIFL
jgi:hypothetical protein